MRRTVGAAIPARRPGACAAYVDELVAPPVRSRRRTNSLAGDPLRAATAPSGTVVVDRSTRTRVPG